MIQFLFQILLCIITNFIQIYQDLALEYDLNPYHLISKIIQYLNHLDGLPLRHFKVNLIYWLKNR